MRIQRMTRALRPLLIFIFPLPFLLGFGNREAASWPGYLAMATGAVLLVSGLWVAWATLRNRS